MRVGLYPGSFDPITNGHCDIIKRATAMVDKLFIGIALSKAKGPLFSIDERVDLVKTSIKTGIDAHPDCEIDVKPFDGLLMHFAQDIGANFIIRGLRAIADFEYEFQLVNMNRRLNEKVETMFLMADPHHQAVASRLVKEIASMGGNIDSFVPTHVAKILYEKYMTN